MGRSALETVVYIKKRNISFGTIIDEAEENCS